MDEGGGGCPDGHLWFLAPVSLELRRHCCWFPVSTCCSRRWRGVASSAFSTCRVASCAKDHRSAKTAWMARRTRRQKLSELRREPERCMGARAGLRGLYSGPHMSVARGVVSERSCASAACSEPDQDPNATGSWPSAAPNTAGGGGLAPVENGHLRARRRCFVAVSAVRLVSVTRTDQLRRPLQQPAVRGSFQTRPLFNLDRP